MKATAWIVAAAGALLIVLGAAQSQAEPPLKVLAYYSNMILIHDEDGALIGSGTPESLPRPPVPVVAWGPGGMVGIEREDGDWIYLRPTDVRLTPSGQASCYFDPGRGTMCSAGPPDRGLPICPGDPRCRRKKKPTG